MRELAEFNLLDTIKAHKERLGWRDATIVLSHSCRWMDVAAILKMDGVTSVIVHAECGSIPAHELMRVGVYFPAHAGWILPRLMSPRLIVIGDLSVSVRMAVRAITAGARHIAFEEKNHVVGLFNMIVSSTVSGIKQRMRKPVARLVGIWSRLRNGRCEFNLDADPILPPDLFDANHVLMINSALAWGGAERQLVNTMIGLHERGLKIDLVCEALGYVPDSDFFKWRLDQRGLKADQIRKNIDLYEGVVTESQYNELMRRVKRLPPSMEQAVIPYALEMLARRPGVLHAWQDQTCILAGVAAAIVGVPKVILATRNVSPVNFAYYQEHMPSVYKALLNRENVRIINNSKAGIEDYCQWLGVTEDKFDLLYNGLDFSDMKTPMKDETAVFRARLNIGSGRKVIGSIFRLYDEKDPILWLETALKVAKKMEDVDFVVFGVGPLREELLEKMAAIGMEGRLHLPGTEKNPALALSIMDVFLLTSRFEGLPNVIIEAQSQRIPVVTTRAGGSGEAILHGQTGWVVEERDSELLAKKVLDVLNDESWRKHACDRAPTFALERFGFERMIGDTLSIYERVPGLN